MPLPLLIALDDSSVVGVGGAVTCLDDLTQVRMVRETVNVDFAKRKVDAKFWFKNEGPQTTVMMGFPEDGAGDVRPPTPDQPTFFKGFRSWVDGKRVETHLLKSDHEENGYRQWWTKKVRFMAGQTRVVRDLYRTTFGYSVMGDDYLGYTMDSGRPWKGAIGRAVVVYDLSGVKRGTWYYARPKPTRVTADRLVWVWNNLEPTPEEDIVVGTLRPGSHWLKDEASRATVPGGKLYRR